MLRRLYTIILVLLLTAAAMPLSAQTLSGIVLDEETGDTLSYASCVYKGHNVAVACDLQGRFTIGRHRGWGLTFSAVGYREQTVVVDNKTPAYMIVRLKPNTQLATVTVKSRRRRYSRKNNPAVELMKKVVEAKNRTNLAHNDYYQYHKYQKLTLAVNDLNPAMLLDSVNKKKRQWLLDQIELCPYNQKLILPVSVQETVSRQLYRKAPHTERTVVEGTNARGVNDLFQTGDILNVLMRDVFSDINIYDDQIRMLQQRFTSPVGDDAVAFYQYYIHDTVYVDRDRCFHLVFQPNNVQDFGFSGQLYILADSTYRVRRCEMTIPNRSDVNFVKNMKVVQEFGQHDNGQWVLTTDDMFTELSYADFIQDFAVIRSTRLTDYDFAAVDDSEFSGSAPVVEMPDAGRRDDQFWAHYRQVQLTGSEASMDSFMSGLATVKGYNILVMGLKLLIENYIETGTAKTPSKFDIGPVNAMTSFNFIDGLRTRFGGQTTANLHPQIFAKGYAARGWDSKKWYYKGELTYSFNKKKYMANEFPQRTVSFASSYDIENPTDKFLTTDKDNVFTAFKWTTVDKMLFCNRQVLTFTREEQWGLRSTLALKTEHNEAAGSLYYTPLTEPRAENTHSFRTTEVHAELRLAPGEKVVNTKQRRILVNREAPVVTLSHDMGIKGVLGGDYRYNLTSLTLLKRFFMKSWGKLDVQLRGAIQWNQVPFPLLIMPETNLSYVQQYHTFGLVNNMEFLNDRYAMASLGWNLNGKLFNRIPLLQHLQWREWLAVRCFWGTLTDKNNPALNSGNGRLMYFPEGTTVMDSKQPYWEVSAGVHNIFKLLHVEYVRRLSYNHLPTAHKQGIRLKIVTSF